MTPPDYKETAQAIWQEAMRFRSFVVGGYDVPDHMDSPPKAIATALTQADALGYARGRGEAMGAREKIIATLESMTATHYALGVLRPALEKIEGPSWDAIFEGLENEKDLLNEAEFCLRALTAEPAKEKP